MSELEKSICPGCNYPAHAGHSKDCKLGNIERYNSEPLPFQSVNQEAQHLTWTDFDNDESGDNVFLYRGLDGVDRNIIQGQEHKSKASSFNETLDEIYARFGTTDKLTISRLATESNMGLSPVLHTTRNKRLAEGLGAQGVVITYKIPKAWLLEDSNKPILGNIGEQELDFLFEIPASFVSKIEQKGEDVEIKTFKAAPLEHEDDIITVELPPPPKDILEPPHNPY